MIDELEKRRWRLKEGTVINTSKGWSENFQHCAALPYFKMTGRQPVLIDMPAADAFKHQEKD